MDSTAIMETTTLKVISGVVERGDARGRTIGFPTANVALEEHTGPADGVYAAWFTVEGRGTHPAAVNIGHRPTFYAQGGVRLAEAHVVSFDGDLYGYRVRVSLVARLRSEMKFESVEEPAEPGRDAGLPLRRGQIA